MTVQEMALWEPERREYVRPTMGDVRAIPWNGLTAVGSFSGCGGSSLGLRMAGWRVPYAIEFIPAAADSYEANAPSTFVDRRDIRAVEPQDVLDRLGLARGDLDLLEGSPPCSSFSTAGKREKGWGQMKKYSDSAQRTDDLFDEWVHLLAGLYPRAFVAENVPGLEMGNAREYARYVADSLGSLGYRVMTRVLTAANFGVPQDRERLIFLGFRRDLRVVPDLGSIQATTPEPFSLAQALDSVDPTDADHEPFLEESSMRPYAVGRAWEILRSGAQFDSCLSCSLPIGAVTIGGRVRVGDVCGCDEPSTQKDYFMLTVPDPSKPCPTLTATAAQVGAASVAHPTECRKFTPAEAKAICGFPADFVLTGSRAQRIERMGRAVPPPLYAVIGRYLAETLLSVG